METGVLSIGLPIGIGIFLYGLTYFFVHDIFIHQDLNFLKKLIINMPKL